MWPIVRSDDSVSPSSTTTPLLNSLINHPPSDAARLRATQILPTPTNPRAAPVRPARRRASDRNAPARSSSGTTNRPLRRRSSQAHRPCRPSPSRWLLRPLFSRWRRCPWKTSGQRSFYRDRRRWPAAATRSPQPAGPKSPERWLGSFAVDAFGVFEHRFDGLPLPVLQLLEEATVAAGVAGAARLVTELRPLQIGKASCRGRG